MPIDIPRLQAENEKSLEAVENSIARLPGLTDELPNSKAILIHDELVRARAEKAHLEMIRGHLRAAGVTVKEMDPSVVSRLDALAARLDRAIRDDFVTSATLELVTATLNAAREVSNITSQHLKDA